MPNLLGGARQVECPSRPTALTLDQLLSLIDKTEELIDVMIADSYEVPKKISTSPDNHNSNLFNLLSCEISETHRHPPRQYYLVHFHIVI